MRLSEQTPSTSQSYSASINRLVGVAAREMFVSDKSLWKSEKRGSHSDGCNDGDRDLKLPNVPPKNASASDHLLDSSL